MNASSHPWRAAPGTAAAGARRARPSMVPPFRAKWRPSWPRGLAPFSVQLCFLEFMTPGLVQGGQMLAAQGYQHIDVVPMFLGVGGHVRGRCPCSWPSFKKPCQTPRCSSKPAIGERANVLAAMAESIAALLTRSPSPPCSGAGRAHRCSPGMSEFRIFPSFFK